MTYFKMKSTPSTASQQAFELFARSSFPRLAIGNIERTEKNLKA